MVILYFTDSVPLRIGLRCIRITNCILKYTDS